MYLWKGFSLLLYSSKHGRQHQCQDSIVYLRYYIDFDCMTEVLKISKTEYFLFMPLNVKEILSLALIGLSEGLVI